MLQFFITLIDGATKNSLKYGNATVKDFRKYEKLEYKKKKLKLDI